MNLLLDLALDLYDSVHLLLGIRDGVLPPPGRDLALVQFVNLGGGTSCYNSQPPSSSSTFPVTSR